LHDALRAFHTLNTVAFIALGAVALITWRRRRDRASVWAAAAFGSLAVLELFALVPTHERNVGEKILTRIEIVILVVFPYLLFRFTNAFRPPGRRLAQALFGLTAILIVWAVAIPRYPQPGEGRDLLIQHNRGGVLDADGTIVQLVGEPVGLGALARARGADHHEYQGCLAHDVA